MNFKNKKNIGAGLIIRQLQKEDCEGMAKTFLFPWVTKEASIQKWEKYFSEQQNNKRWVFICEKSGSFVGYGTLLLDSDYPEFKNNKIPEISDLWIDSHYRSRNWKSSYFPY
ncbi:MAG: hypothetical protein WB791_07430 [Waddliaceae bacterium]